MESNIILKYFRASSTGVESVKFGVLDEHDIADFVASRGEDSRLYHVPNNIEFWYDSTYINMSDVDILSAEQLFTLLKALCYPYLYDSRLYIMNFHDYEYIVMCYEGICAVALTRTIGENSSPSELYKQFYSAREMRLKPFKLTDWTMIYEIPRLSGRRIQ